MSAGDLDGDVYMVIWDKEIVEAVADEEICEPAPVENNILLEEEK